VLKESGVSAHSVCALEMGEVCVGLGSSHFVIEREEQSLVLE
jgi:hypothetical protein